MNYLIAGLTLGFAAGVSPGPLLTLVITRTLARGLGAGVRVAIAPLLTDLPIILVTVTFFAILPPLLEKVLTVAGGIFVLYLAWETLRSARTAHLTTAAPDASAASADLWQGMLVNFLSPHPWLFWIGVAAPLLTSAWQSSAWAAMGWLAGFYGMLVGSKMMVAFAVAGGRRFLNDAWYRRLLVASALLLAFFGIALLWQTVT